MAKLVIKYDDVVVSEVELKQGDMTIGRRSANDIVIENMAVSGNHASIFTIGEDSFIEDRASTNGTFINNRKIVKHHLKHGDTILVGKHTLVYVNDQPACAENDNTILIHPAARTLSRAPAGDKKRAHCGAIFILSGANSGKRIDLTKPVTALGKTGKPAGKIVRKEVGYLLQPAAGETQLPRLNGKTIPLQGAELKSGDIIEVGDTRLQFHLR